MGKNQLHMNFLNSSYVSALGLRTSLAISVVFLSWYSDAL